MFDRLIGLKASGLLVLAAGLNHLSAGRDFYAALCLIVLSAVCAVIYRREGWVGERRSITVQTFNFDFSETEVVTYEIDLTSASNEELEN